MSNPTFSIIVPVYNVERYLKKCINSILNQTYRDFELILVDDGSSDASGNICDQYEQNDYRVDVIHMKNAGVSLARNAGLDKANGEYICFIDSDDWVDPYYLQVIRDNVPEFDILFFGAVWHYEDDSLRSLSLKPEVCRNGKVGVDKAILHLLENDTHVNYFGYTWNKVFRRDIIEAYNIRFVKDLSVSEDEVFTLAYCINCQSLRIIDTPLYHYLWKIQGLTHKQNPPHEWNLLADSFQKLLCDIDNKNLVQSYKRRIASFYHVAALLYSNPLDVLEGEFRFYKYCKKNNVGFSVKNIIKSLLKKM